LSSGNETFTVDGVPSAGNDWSSVSELRGTETIGQRLRRLRLERGLSQRDLAVQGVSYAYISRIEAGTRQPSVKALRKLAGKLGVTPDYLETGADLRIEEARELQLADAEIQLRLGDDPLEAAASFSSVLRDATSAGDQGAASRALYGLGFAAALQGRHDEAIEHLERGLAAEGATAVSHPDVFTTLGRAYAAVGRPADAVTLFDECLDELEQEAPEDAVARTRFATFLSYALADMGELERAEDVLERTVRDSDSLTDVWTRVRIYWSLARLASMQSRAAVALRYARRAVALLEATEDTIHLAQAHQLCGAILTTRGDAVRAREHLDRAEQLLGSRPQPLDLASLRTEQAKNAASLGRGAQAVVLAREALAVLGDNDPAERGAALWALAQGLALEGDLSGADVTFGQSVELLHDQRRWRDVKLASGAWAELLESAGRERDAAAIRDRYADVGAAVHAGER
jgi:transcriptional regulator with XRE-family HTH domain